MFIVRKLAVVAMVALTTFALTGSSAFAFFCYNGSRSPQGNAAAAGSPAHLSIGEALVLFCGVSEANVPAALAMIEADGFRTDILINERALMAGGLYNTGNTHLLHNGKGVEHLTEAFFASAEAAAEAVGGSCE